MLSDPEAGLDLEELVVGAHDFVFAQHLSPDVGDITLDALELPCGGLLVFVDTDIGG